VHFLLGKNDKGGINVDEKEKNTPDKNRKNSCRTPEKFCTGETIRIRPQEPSPSCIRGNRKISLSTAGSYKSLVQSGRKGRFPGNQQDRISCGFNSCIFKNTGSGSLKKRKAEKPEYIRNTDDNFSHGVLIAAVQP
jgi:hypothetical protein